MSHVLIVDDEEAICWALSRMLREDGHDVTVASSAEEAIEAARQRVADLVVLDVRLPGMDGLAAMGRLRELIPAAPIVIMTAFGSLETAVTALGNGAWDYLPKPFDVDSAAAVLRRALAAGPAEGVPRDTEPRHAGQDLLGASPAMQEVFKRIALAAPADAAILITGESGTGKELAARAIHRHSRQSQAAFVPVNLASLSASVVESELFGHVRGAFTGAHAARQGLLELADGGTVFFDEVADVPLSVQVKLLRVLEQREVTAVGDTRPRRTEFRVLAATNRDLRREVREGRFREDLYFRLAVFEIALPPLGERADDIPLLAEHFLRGLNAAAGTQARLAPETIDELCRRRWPGNVRELRNAVEHAVILARGGSILPSHLPAVAAETHLGDAAEEAALAELVRSWAENVYRRTPAAENLHARLLDLIERPLFAAALKQHGGHRVKAAASLGLHRMTLRKRMRALGFEEG